MDEKRTRELGIAAVLGLAALAPVQGAAAQSCQTDSECAGGMVCHTTTYESCSGSGGCDAGDCPPPEPSICEHVSESRCTPRYNLPCSVDSDCGGGFRCTEQRWVECWGDGNTGGSDAGGADTGGSDTGGNATGGSDNGFDNAAVDAGPAQPGTADGGSAAVCHEVPSGSFYCELLTLACEGDADCPTGLTCQGNDEICTYPDVGPGDGGWVEPECAVPAGQPLQVCRPPYYEGGSGTDGGTGGGGNSGWEIDAGVGGGDADAGYATGDSNGGGSSTGGAPTGEDDGEDGGENADDEHGHHGGGHGKLGKVLRAVAGLFAGDGCSVAGSSEQRSSGNLSLVLGVGLALLAGRRRRS